MIAGICLSTLDGAATAMTVMSEDYGADTAAIIASASQNVDGGFIMTMQTLRFLSVLFFGPFLARLLSPRKGAE